MNIKNAVNAIKFYYKQNGFKKTTKKIFKAVYNRTINKQVYYKANPEDYKLWIKNNEPTIEELEEQRNYKFEYEPKISIVVPMYNTPINYFEELVDCLINQTYTNWELCLADGSNKENEDLKPIIKKDERIKYQFLNENKGISENTNAAIKMVTGDYIALVDHDDLLPIFALYEIVKTINENKEVEFIYTDEDNVEEQKENRCNPHFKPDFSIDTLRANNYITHLSVYKKELINKLGGLKTDYNGAQDYDLILRTTEITNKIVHIPKILYHWRINPNSTSMIVDAKPYAYEAGKRAIEDHLKRQNLEAEVFQDEDIKGFYKINYKVKENPKVAIIIPNKDAIKILKRCIDSIINLTTYENYEILIIENNSENTETFEYYKQIEQNEKIKVLEYKEKGFNYSKLINFGVKNTDAEFILQLNNDTELLTKDWLQTFIGYAQRKEVGAVGAKLFFEDKTVQHAGIGIGIDDVAANLFVRIPESKHAYFARESLTRNIGAVTGACLFARKDIYEEVGYMDEEKFSVAFNDVDFCMKIREKGYLIIYNPYIKLIHYESKTRGYETTEEKSNRFEIEKNNFISKWRNKLYDPYSNINFDKHSANYKVRTDKIN